MLLSHLVRTKAAQQLKEIKIKETQRIKINITELSKPFVAFCAFHNLNTY